ncbi:MULTISPECIES: hypothetical protein [Rhodomicrobium]|uniref:hypothetical protein n=1 Tax=Rhodomicrobium TaxID=1068 RepID=UPI000F744336|nr:MULTISPECIES: hypothetical protein [Rhodomicrobium]
MLAADNGTVIDVLGRFPGLAILPVTIPARHPVAAGPLPLPRYDGAEIETFHLLRCLLRRAIRDADSWLLGQVATSSARIHQRRQPKPGFDALLNVAASFDAIGVAVAAGNRAALLFDPGKQDLEWSMHAAARALRELGMGCVVDAPSRSIRPGL